jgi:uncharacterized protein YfiM (DUF2279 family)
MISFPAIENEKRLRMKYQTKRTFLWIFILLIIFSISNNTVFSADGTLLHFGVSSVFGAAGESFLHYKTNLKTSGRIILGTALGSIPGLVKEMIDSTEKGNSFSGADLAADIAGAFIGALVANIVNNKIKITINKTKHDKVVTLSLSFQF